VNVDNVGAIFIAENASATSRTKHIDVRYHFIRELIEDGTIKIVFVKSENNKADMFTKNVSGDIYDRHKRDFIIRKDELKNIMNESDCDIKGGVSRDINSISFDTTINSGNYVDVNLCICDIGYVYTTRIKSGDVDHWQTPSQRKIM
jgi:hypothetical protein